MAVPAPNVTKISWNGGAEQMMLALYAHFDSTSTDWEIDPGSTVNSAGGAGFTIRPQAAPGWHINLRRTSTSVVKGILDPAGSITNSGNTSAAPTGASSGASPEEDHMVCATSGAQEMLLLEWDDAYVMFLLHSSGSYMIRNAFGGDHYVNVFSNKPDADNRGLVLHGSTSSLNYVGIDFWSTTYAKPRYRFGAGDDPADWYDALITIPSVSTGVIPDDEISGDYYPAPLGLTFGTGTTLRLVGYMKYIHCVDTARTALVRLSDSGGTVRFMHFSDNGTSGMVVAWPDGVDPAAL